MMLWSLLLVALVTAGCDRGSRADKPLVGTWREQGGQDREYVLRDDGTFTIRLSAAKCEGARDAATTTMSGTWSSQEGRILLVVKSSSDPVFEGSTMSDTIRTLDGATLVLDSSVSSCAGREVRLSKQ